MASTMQSRSGAVCWAMNVKCQRKNFTNLSIRGILFLSAAAAAYLNQALQRTAASRYCSNRRASWPPSLSLGR